MRRELDYDKLREYVLETQRKLKHCPFCGSPAQITNNVGSWDGEPEFIIGCSSQSCFLHDNALTALDMEEWTEFNFDTMTGLKRILSRMRTVWNHRAKEGAAK